VIMTDVLGELAKEFTQILRTETTSVTAVPAARDALAAILAHKDGASWRADVITSAAKRLGWDYRRDTEGGLVCFTFYGQGQHFEGVKHEICQVQILPDRVRFSRRFEFSKSREDVEADYQARGHDPALVDSPALHPYGLPEEDDMLPAAVIVAADHQYRVIVERLREELAKAEQERDTAVTQAAGDSGHGEAREIRSKRGRSKYTKAEKIKVVEDWAALDPDTDTRTLTEFLIDRFGETGSVPNVADQTFYTWRSKYGGRNS
jgi:hypothetical protein